MITDEEYLDAKKIVDEYQKQLNVPSDIKLFIDLSNDEKSYVHEVLFQMDILDLEEEDKVEKYYNMLPENIKRNGAIWGLSDSVVRDDMHEWFENNVLNKK